MLMPNRVWTLKRVMKLLNELKTRGTYGACICYGAFAASGGMFNLQSRCQHLVLIQYRWCRY